MGKTAFALNIARNAAVDENGVRWPSSPWKCPRSSSPCACSVRRGAGRPPAGAQRFFQRPGLGRLTERGRVLAEAPIFIDDSADSTAMEIRAKARRLMLEKGLGMVIVDYLQLMRSSTSSERRDLEISEISRSLKALAKELNVPVIALSQLNRKLEERADKRPQLADLRESGALEQDADVVAFIYRDEVYNKDENNPNRGKAEIILGKQRNGPIGTAHLAFLNVYTRFENLAPEHES
jgi:replicative DNA helicase